MAWYIGQSLLMLGASFGVGLLVGWMAWRWPWRRRRFGESEVIAALNRQHTLELAERDERVARLQDQLFAPQQANCLAASSALDREHPAPRDSARAGGDRTADLSSNSAVDLPGVWLSPDAELIEDAGLLRSTGSAENAARAQNAAQLLEQPPGPRPPARFPAAADLDPGAPDSTETDLPEPEQRDVPAAPPAQVDLRVPATPGRPRPPSQAVRPGGSQPVADLREDDLTRIVGIGEDTARTLRAAGLRTYQDLARARPHDVAAALQPKDTDWSDIRRTWPRQAQLLADGDTEGFDRLARELRTDHETTQGQQ